MDPSGRYLQRGDGAPFFYLADTAWELLHRCTLAETEFYLRDRAAKGFTVIQTVILAELDGLRVPNAHGDLPFLDAELQTPNERYFAHIDSVLGIAENLGLTVGLLPTWGDKWNLMWGIGPEVLTPASAERFGEYVGRRYAERDVIWILGGDRPAEKAEHLEVVRGLAAGVRRGDRGRNLMTAHVWGQHSTSEYFADEPWLEFHTIQSGHARNFENWALIETDYAASPPKPCMDMEPAYEEGIDAIGNLAGGFIDAYDVRKALYWSLFAGAHGHTYGCWPIWQMWDHSREPRMWVTRPWREALQATGSDQVRHAKDLLLSRPFFTRVPDQSLIVGDAGRAAYHVRATRDEQGSFAMVYVPSGSPVDVDLRSLQEDDLMAWWFDPRTGASQLIGARVRAARATFEPPAGGPDWVLVVDAAGAGHGRPGTPATTGF